MNKLALPLVVSMLALCGCAHHYVIKLNGGREITTTSKPKLKGSAYYFKDSKGQMVSVSQGRVQQIEPTSMAREDESANQFKPQSPKKHHWYWPF